MKNKHEKFSELVSGKNIVDVGFAQVPNKYLKGNVTGIDIQRVKKPQNYKKVLALNLNYEKIPLKNNSQDTVLLGDVIEHVENPSFLLREANRILRNEGKLILSTPHANDLWTNIHNWFLPFIKDQDEGEHLSNWAKLDMIRLLKKNGFKVKKIYGISLDIPFIHLRLPIGPFYMLSWVLIYECIKIKDSEIRVITKNNNGKILRI
jgi:2-polyprenyl-3-methyl-5-hydroxy-6-metoxy-1,4-benzoquinol methylase